jgi:hypothetical protein
MSSAPGVDAIACAWKREIIPKPIIPNFTVIFVLQILWPS